MSAARQDPSNSPETAPMEQTAARGGTAGWPGQTGCPDMTAAAFPRGGDGMGDGLPFLLSLCASRSRHPLKLGVGHSAHNILRIPLSRMAPFPSSSPRQDAGHASRESAHSAMCPLLLLPWPPPLAGTEGWEDRPGGNVRAGRQVRTDPSPLAPQDHQQTAQCRPPLPLDNTGSQHA
jgi:hypothetical protein